MRLPLLSLSVLFLVGCSPKEAPAPPPPPPPPLPTVADFAGNWTASNVLNGVADPVPSVLHSTESGAEWYMQLDGRDSIPMHVSTKGDSLILISDKYESVLRKGVIVQVRTAAVRAADQLSGSLVATYDSPTGQELVTGTFTATRAP